MAVLCKVGGIISLLMPLVGGCATPPARLPAEKTLESVMVARLTAGLGGRSVRLAVGNSARPAAYSWPDGRVLVTRGLLRLLDEEQVAAAVAHELGHLVVGGHVSTPAALGGATAVRDVESRADAAGRELLRVAGYDPGAMARMLQTVAASPDTGRACRARLLDRVERLHGR
jgi:predicted Zn-dependent protease